MGKLIVEESLRPGVTALTLNRPEKRNALNTPMLEALCAALERVTAAADQRVLVIRGAGPVLCAGLDLKEAQDPGVKEQSGALVREMLQRVYECPCVTIAAVHGAAMAGGGGLMAACDIAIGTMDARFGFPEVHRGLVAGLIMTFRGACGLPGKHQVKRFRRVFPIEPPQPVGGDCRVGCGDPTRVGVEVPPGVVGNLLSCRPICSRGTRSREESSIA